MSYLTKNDFLYFKNDVLQDIKKVESKLTEKIGSLFSYIQEITSSTEKRFDSLNSLIKKLSEYDHSEVEQKIFSQIDNLKKKLEEASYNNSSKINMISRDLSNACYKYDKIILENLKVTGIVGEGCPYNNLKMFIEYINKKLKEIGNSKDKANNETNILKEKINNISIQLKTELENIKIRTKELIYQKNIENEKKCLERIRGVEELIKDVRLENYKYSNDLIKKTENIQLDREKLENVKYEISDKYNAEKNKFKKYTENLMRTFDSQKNEYNIIKSRIIELRDILKNIKFNNDMTNGNINLNDENRKEIKALPKKLNFFKNKKTNKKNLEKIKNENNLNLMDIQEEEDNNKINNNDIIKFINKIKSPKEKRHKSALIKKYEISININKNKENNKKIKQNENINEINDDFNIKKNNEDDIVYNKNPNENNFSFNSEENIISDNTKNPDEIDNEDNNNNYSFELISNIKGNKIKDDKNEIHNININKLYDNEKREKIRSSKNQIKRIVKPKSNETSKTKYTKIKIKSLNNKIQNNDNNIDVKIDQNIDKNSDAKIDQYIDKNVEKNIDKNITTKNNRPKQIIAKNENSINETPEIFFSKTLSNINKNTIFKEKEEKEKNLVNTFNSNEIINNQNNENDKIQEKDYISDINFISNNIRKKIFENKNNQTKFSSFSDDEKNFNSFNFFHIPTKNCFHSEIKKEDKYNYNILPLNFEEKTNLIKENNINSKLFYRKIIHHLNRFNFAFNEKFKNFSSDIYKYFDIIKNEINLLYNEINKINSNKNKKIKNETFLNFKINNYDLYNNSGIELNMKNLNKKINVLDCCHSFFSRNKLFKKFQIEEKSESPRNILNNVESFLIKKFKNEKLVKQS